MRVVGYDPFVAPERFRELGVEHAQTGRRLRRGRLPHAAPAADRRDARLRRRRRARADARRRPDRQRRPRRARRRGGAGAGRPRRQGRRGRARRLLGRAVHRASCSSSTNVVVTPHLAASTEEAQDRAGVIVAEQVVAALEGGLVTNAVNIPIVGAEDLELLGPYIPLAAKLGRLAVELAGGPAAPDRALLQRRDRRPRHAPAHGRGAERRLPGPRRAGGQLRQRARDRRRARDRGERGALDRRATTRASSPSRVDDVEVSGTTIGPEHRHFLAGALGFAIDLQLSPRMVFFRYDDIPGVIGRVGTMFGEARRQHREHGRLADEGGRQGADGALDRLRAAARARRAGPRGRASTTPASSAASLTMYPRASDRDLARARRAGRRLPPGGRRRGAARGAPGARHGDRRGRRPRGRLPARPDRQVDRRRLRRPAGARARPGRPARRPRQDRPGGRRGEGQDRAPGGGRGGDRLRAGRRRAVPAPERRERPDRPEPARPRRRLGRRRLGHAPRLAPTRRPRPARPGAARGRRPGPHIRCSRPREETPDARDRERSG